MDDEKLKILSFTAPKNFKSGRLIMGRSIHFNCW